MHARQLYTLDPGEPFLIVGAVGALVHVLTTEEIVCFEEGVVVPDSARPLILVVILDIDLVPKIIDLPNEEFSVVMETISSFKQSRGCGWQAWAVIEETSSQVFLRFSPNTESYIEALTDPLAEAESMIHEVRDSLRLVKAGE